MKKIIGLLVLFGGLTSPLQAASAATEMTIWYSPTCPHCHDAREFARDVLIPEFGENIVITETNASAPENGRDFAAAVRECKLEGGFVPLITIGEKCFQGFSETIGTQIKSAIQESGTSNQEPVDNDEQITTNDQRPTNTNWALYGLLAALALAMGFVLFARKKR